MNTTPQIMLSSREAATILGVTVRRLCALLGSLYPGWQPEWPVPESIVRELYRRFNVQL